MLANIYTPLSMGTIYQVLRELYYVLQQLDEHCYYLRFTDGEVKKHAEA